MSSKVASLNHKLYAHKRPSINSLLKVGQSKTDLWDDSVERASFVPEFLSILLRAYRQLTEVASCEWDSVII